jgi:hypothetical protein
VTREADRQSKPRQYMPDGNVKWGRLEVDTRDPAKPRVDFQVQPRASVRSSRGW